MYAYFKRGFAVFSLLALLQAAPVRADDTPLLVPTSGWLVGPSTLSADGTDGLPCVMTNQFSNGFTMRLSGGNGRILGFVLDVRQKLFSAGAAETLTVSIGRDFRESIKAEAYDAATLMANMQALPDFYDALEDTRSMTVDLGQGRRVEFVMLGVRDGLRRLEQCFDPSAAPQNGQAATPAPRQQTLSAAQAAPDRQTAPPGASVQSLPARSADELTAGAPVSAPYTARSAVPERPIAATAPAGAAIQEQNGGVAAAYRQLLNERLSLGGDNPRTGMKSGEPDKGQNANPAGRMAPEGTGRDQVMQKMLENATRNLREGVTSGVLAPQQAASVAPAAGTAGDGRPSVDARSAALMAATRPQKTARAGNSGANPGADPVADMGRHWYAPAGAGLRGVLTSWAQKADTRLVWQAEGDYPVQAALTAQGSFESAVRSVLTQFQQQDKPPLGQIYYDQDEGRKVLLVTQ